MVLTAWLLFFLFAFDTGGLYEGGKEDCGKQEARGQGGLRQGLDGSQLLSHCVYVSSFFFWGGGGEVRGRSLWIRNAFVAVYCCMPDGGAVSAVACGLGLQQDSGKGREASMVSPTGEKQGYVDRQQLHLPPWVVTHTVLGWDHVCFPTTVQNFFLQDHQQTLH